VVEGERTVTMTREEFRLLRDLIYEYCGITFDDASLYLVQRRLAPRLATLSMAGRLTCSNLAIEAGAKTGLFRADGVTRTYLAGLGVDAEPQAEEEADYARELDLDLGGIEPLVAVPHRVDSAVPVDRVAGTPVDQVFVGTCTNGRLEDLEVFAAAVRSRRVAVRTIVIPASRRVLADAIRSGALEAIVEAGCTVGPPGCGPCLGTHLGVLGEGEVCLSTANRNFRNRMGVGGEIYLASVGTAAATALAGEIAPPAGAA
jgi:methanogen homoaconitase large subunit